MSFHHLLFMPHRSYPELNPAKHCYACKIIEDRIWRLFKPKSLNKTLCCMKVTHELDTTSSLIFNVMVSISPNRLTRYNLNFVVKWSRNHELLPNFTQRLEHLFYDALMPYLKKERTILPHCYRWLLTKYAILVMDDMTANEYYTVKNWTRTHLEVCLKYLAHFHSRMLQLKNDDCQSYNDFCENILQRQMGWCRSQQLIKCRFFENDTIWNKLKCSIRMRLNEKIKNIQAHIWENTCAFSTIIHGRLVQSKVMFKCNVNKEPKWIKILGWQAVTIDSPAIDFGRIVLSNLPNYTDVKLIYRFFREMLMHYLRCRNLNSEDREHLKIEIINNLIRVYINHYWTIEHPIEVLYALRKLGAF